MSCIVKSYLFSSFTDMVRRPMKIGSADEVCSHLNQVLTASSVNDSACSEHSYDLTGYFQYIVFKVQGDKASCRTFMVLSDSLSSGDGEIRTLDPLLARQVLSQLSYTPTNRFPLFFCLVQISLNQWA